MASARTSGVAQPPGTAKATAMALREQLMEYFKGTCVQRFIAESNIYLQIQDGPRRFQYQRQALERQAPCEVFIDEIPVMSLQKFPDTIVLYDKILNRSPQFREVRNEIESFLDRYLAAIEVKHDQRGAYYADNRR